MADRGDDEVPLNRPKSPYLEVIQPEQSLFVLEASLDMPARERHVQATRDRRCGRGVGDEVLDLTGHRMFGINQPGRSGWYCKATASAFWADVQSESRRFDSPDDRSFVAVLDVEVLPVLIAHGGRIRAEPINAIGPARLGCQAGITPGTPVGTRVMVLLQYLGFDQPAGERLRHLGHVGLPHLVQRFQESSVASVAFIERQPLETNAIPMASLKHIQGDLPFRLMGKIVGNMSFATAFTIVGP